MNLRIAGMGWVTPLGRGVDHVWQRLVCGEHAQPQSIADPISKNAYCAFRVPNDALQELAPHPRLRRASAISRFAAAAGLDAIACARSTIGQIDINRLALVFAVSNGGVIYTKRFYHDVVETGAQAASPLLFPETVFNAPASHLAAILGIAGATYTLVGDSAVGALATKMAADLLEDETLEACLVVGTEEADWVLCDAYHKWRLLKNAPPVELFQDRPRGMILSEGAGALLLAREGFVSVDATDPGGIFYHRREANQIVRQTLDRLVADDACLVSSANGTFVDLAERAAANEKLPDAIVYSLKAALGESVGASAIWQIIAAAQILRTKRVPPRSPQKGANAHDISCKCAIVLACGVNQQIAGVRLRI